MFSAAKTSGPSGYNLTNSLRFRSSATAYLSRTPASAGNRRTWTWSGWVKRGSLGGSQGINYAFINTNSADGSSFQPDNTLEFSGYLGGASYALQLVTTQVFRDPSAWYHIVFVLDTTQATAANRAKIYVNGQQITSFNTATYPAQNTELTFNSNCVHTLAATNYTLIANPFDGYMTDINFIDGQALTPSSFGSTNATTGVWQPAKYTGTYGTNGFYLPFSLSATSSYAGSFSGTGKYLTTPASGYTQYINGSGNFTIEFWANYSALPTGGTNQGCSWYAQDSGSAVISPFNLFQSGNTWSLYASTNGSGWDVFSNTTLATTSLTTNTWYHIACVRNGNTLTLYVDGVAVGSQSLTASLWSTNTYTTYLFGPWQSSGSTNGFQGSISNYRLVKGTAVYTANFTPPTTALTNITNTSLLTLQSATVIDNSSNAFTITNPGSVTTATATPFVANIAADASGNNNGWIPNNINVATSTATTYDSMTDVPTLTSATVANYAVLNPVIYSPSTTYSRANLSFTASNTNWTQAVGTIVIPSTGKWYWEVVVGSSIGAGQMHGITATSSTLYSAGATNWVGWNPLGYAYFNDGTKYNNNAGVAYGNSYTANDIIGIAFDADNGKLFFSKNGTWQASGDPVAGTNAAFTGLTGNSFYPAFSLSTNTGASTADINFGQRPFSYTPPTGFVRLNTYNLPNSTVVKGNSYMDATLWTGNGATSVAVTNTASFKPDLVWVKTRNQIRNHILFDSVRGAGSSLGLSSNLTDSEGLSAGNQTSVYGYVSSFNSNGFTGSVGSTNINYYNANADTYVGWQWQAGQGTTSSNTQGTITTTTSVNTTAGFSVFTFTGTGASSASIGHGLGVAPKFMIFKQRNGTSNWNVLTNATGSNQYGFLNLTTTFAAAGETWTSTVINIGANFTNGSTYVCYAWAEIAGFNKFGSYTGNANSDGPFVYCGFRPKYIMLKNASATYNWVVWDTVRSTYNVMGNYLVPNLSDAEASINAIDILSNGFKIRDPNAFDNGSGNTIIFAAFAENPFKNALAR